MPSRPKKTENMILRMILGLGEGVSQERVCFASLINRTIYKLGVVFTKPALGSRELADLLVPTACPLIHSSFSKKPKTARQLLINNSQG